MGALFLSTDENSCDLGITCNFSYLQANLEGKASNAVPDTVSSSTFNSTSRCSVYTGVLISP